MNEIEIVAYLKENKTNGVMYDFMPPDVRRWCEKHRDEFIFVCYHSCDWHGNCSIGNGNYVYSLPDDYELKPQFKPHWEEFKVNEDGRFCSLGDLSYSWYRWFDFLNNNADRYNNFGGYVYKELPQKSWQTYPVVAYNEKEPPLFPTKIRFWRYAE